MHQRARDFIDNILTGPNSIITAPFIQKQLKATINLTVSAKTIRLYLKQVLGLSYKKISVLPSRVNKDSSKFQRQVAASHYVEFLHRGLTIINIDESSLDQCDSRHKSWSLKGQTKKAPFSERLD